jgi:hypothetical protein
VAVPLVVVGEASLVGRVDAPASNRDLRRTILDSVGLPCDSCGEVDLRTATESPVAGGLPPRLLFRIADGFKLVLDHKTGSRQLFDLARDPLELRNVLAEHPKVADVLSDGLTPLSVLRRPPDDAAERLRALGYSAP